MGDRLLLLLPLARLSDLGTALLRLVTGIFLIHQSHDNVISRERMVEFEKFMAQFDFVHPELLAPLSVYCQFICGILLVLGLLTRWAGLIIAFNFVVAVWMVHWQQDFQGWWPALILVFLGIFFATAGAGRYAADAFLAGRTNAARR